MLDRSQQGEFTGRAALVTGALAFPLPAAARRGTAATLHVDGEAMPR